MSWILKQAEDILNRVDQQTNAAVHQHNIKTTTKQMTDESISDTSSLNSSNKLTLNFDSTNRSTIGNRLNKKNDDSDLIDYLNSSTLTNNKTNRTAPFNNVLSDTTRTASSPNMFVDDSSKPIEQLSSKSASGTPRSITPAVQSHDDDEGLVLDVSSKHETTVNNNKSEAASNQSSNLKDEVVASLQTEIETLMRDKRQYENELQTYKRQLIQYQHQIAESDALLRDLRARESDSMEVVSAKDSQIALLRVRLAESDELVKTKTFQCEQLQNQCARILQDHTDSSGIQSQAFDSLQLRITQLEQELQQRLNENERLIEEKNSFEKRSNDERQQLIEQLKLTEKRLHDERSQIHEQQQQTKHAKNLTHQLEQDMNEYKAKAQRILQTKDKLITKLKEIVQHRNNIPISGEQHDIETLGTTDIPSLHDVHLVGNAPTSPSASSSWGSVQYEELKAENELFKQELQVRELTIHTLRSELQEAELLVQHADEQLHEQTNQLNEQLKDERAHLTLGEQDYRKLKQELTYMHDEFHKQKQTHITQLNERERELERLRLQLTAKTISHVNDDELEKRLQTLTESLIHKQTIIETLQTDKSSLTMQLERLEKRLDDYEKISSLASNNSLQQTSKRLQTTTISIDMDNNGIYDNDHEDTLRPRIPLLRETPYDPDITKKVKRAANELDKLGIRLGIFLKRYPAVRLGVIFYAILLHLWTLIVLFTYTPEVHGNLNPLDVSKKS
ncbi:unnamed protein product [Rotaria sp. Silwood2]|nr:unnamed protein product [Rotaria sp. Silwood2]CAF2504733.1 unnamed protein product [Rotaria sp. Silwood2]CAF2902947.1 unnamed protein product [Rotaria sp. Silwood2]CAF4101082.1 unnamed protein product [Rotaria sp. Silwood2]CAF4296891.1 unnamed protein product [Rotaria sp. Silwood2]